MKTHLQAMAFGLVALGLAGCQDWRFGFYNGPDRPGAELGLPPPADFESCTRPTNAVIHADADGDGRTDTVHVMNGDAEVCRGTDTDKDGRLDTWEQLRYGKVVRSAHDTDGNGRTDAVWTANPYRPGCGTVQPDHDGDGKPDPGPKYDLCAMMGGAPGVIGGAPPPAPALAPLAPLAPRVQ